LGKYKEALDDANKCLQLDPSFGKGYGRKAAALAGLGQVEEAIDAYKQGLSKDPNNTQMSEALQILIASLPKPQPQPQPQPQAQPQPKPQPQQQPSNKVDEPPKKPTRRSQQVERIRKHSIICRRFCSGDRPLFKSNQT